MFFTWGLFFSQIDTACMSLISRLNCLVKPYKKINQYVKLESFNFYSDPLILQMDYETATQRERMAETLTKIKPLEQKAA